MHETFIVNWIENSGLTREECGMIQPTYPTQGEIDNYTTGGNGLLISDFGLGAYSCFSHTIARNSDINYLACNTNKNGKEGFVILALDYNNNPVYSFGDSGKFFFNSDSNFKPFKLKTNVNYYQNNLVLYGNTTVSGKICIMALFINSKGKIDSGFANNGILIIDNNNRDEYFVDGETDRFGNIFILGKANPGNSKNIVLAKINSIGKMYQGFGTNGMVRFDFFGSNIVPKDLEIDDESQHYIGGTCDRGSKNQIWILRSTNPQTDYTFSDSGIKFLEMPNSNWNLASILVPNGSIFACSYNPETGGGVQIYKLKWSGKSDSSFGNNGLLELPIQCPASTPPRIHAFFINGWDLSLVMAYSDIKSTDTNFALARFLEDGKPDSQFGTNGYVITDCSGKSDYLLNLAVTMQGRITCSGYSFENSVPKVTITKHYNTGRPLNSYTITKNELHVFPNPVKNILMISQKDKDILNVTIFDLTGKSICVNSGRSSMDVSELKPGFYIMRVDSKGLTLTVKFYKE